MTRGIPIDSFNEAMGIMTGHQPAVTTVEEVAAYLRIPRSSVHKLTQEGRIPCQKVGRHWRFHRKTIDEWLSNLDHIFKILAHRQVMV